MKKRLRKKQEINKKILELNKAINSNGKWWLSLELRIKSLEDSYLKQKKFNNAEMEGVYMRISKIERFLMKTVCILIIWFLILSIIVVFK